MWPTLNARFAAVHAYCCRATVAEVHRRGWPRPVYACTPDHRGHVQAAFRGARQCRRQSAAASQAVRRPGVAMPCLPWIASRRSLARLCSFRLPAARPPLASQITPDRPDDLRIIVDDLRAFMSSNIPASVSEMFPRTIETLLNDYVKALGPQHAVVCRDIPRTVFAWEAPCNFIGALLCVARNLGRCRQS